MPFLEISLPTIFFYLVSSSSPSMADKTRIELVRCSMNAFVRFPSGSHRLPLGCLSILVHDVGIEPTEQRGLNSSALPELRSRALLADDQGFEP